MRLTIAIAAALLLACNSGAAFAKDAGIEASLRKMDPTTRLVQLCDLAVMTKTSNRKDGVTEHAVIDALSRTHIGNTNTAEGDGGAFRRRGHWYAFSYSCTATPDHMRVTRLTIDIKREIPKSEWAAKGLYP